MNEQSKPMPHFSCWHKMLTRTRGAAHAAEIMARAQTRYDELRARAPLSPIARNAFSWSR